MMLLTNVKRLLRWFPYRRVLFRSPISPSRVTMFAKVKDGRDAGQTRFGRSARPVTLPSFLRPDPDGKLAVMYRRIKTASTTSKLPAGRDRRELAKRPVTAEYAHVKSPVGDYIRRPFISPTNKQMAFKDIWSGDVPPAPPVRGNRNETTQYASSSDYVGKDFERVGIEELGDSEEDFGGESQNLCRSFRCSKAELCSVWTGGIAEVQQSKSTSEVFERFANTYHDILERVSYKATTANSSTQTSTPKLQRTQMNFIYAGFWESYTSRQHQNMQTEELNLTFMKQRTAHLKNTSFVTTTQK